MLAIYEKDRLSWQNVFDHPFYSEKNNLKITENKFEK